jgi:tetratricopeptide (TPR) repeat protein
LEADAAAIRREKVRAALATLDPALSDTQPYLFSLLTIAESPDPLAQMDPQVKLRRTLDALKRIVLRESVKQPVVIVFEDLHWIDGETQALLDLLADGIANARVLLLVNYRPEYRHEWGNKSFYTQLRLDRLGRESAAEMLSALLGDGVDLNSLKRLIIERTEGNPFFIEEMVQTLFNEGAIARNGIVRFARPLSQLRLPPTVQAVLASRIDRLGREQKELLQTMAVIGRTSSVALISKIAALGDSELERILSVLQAGEFIYERPTASGIEYTFKHALTQEVAYNSLLIERRKALHERVAMTVELLYSDTLDNHLSELAFHYSRSANTRKAVHFLGLAGRQAQACSANSEALAFLTQGLELLQELPDDAERAHEECDLQMAVSWLFYATEGPLSAERQAAIDRAKELAEKFGDEARLTDALVALSNVMLNFGGPAVRELAEQALALAQRVGDTGLLAAAHMQIGAMLFYNGEFSAAREYYERGLELFGPGPYRNFWEADRARWSAISVNVISAILGYPDTARNGSDKILATARQSGDPAWIAHALFSDAWVNYPLGDACRVLGGAEEQLTIGTEYGMGAYLPQGTLHRGWALAVQRQTDEGVHDMLRRFWLRIRTMGRNGMLVSLIAETYLAIGRPEEGLEVISDGLAGAEKTGHRYYEARLHHLKGRLLLMQNSLSADEAENCFRTAIEVARRQGAKLFELGATTSLARLLAQLGHRDEARMMLADIYNWFTEGFDTTDLKEAKALLDDLSH